MLQVTNLHKSFQVGPNRYEVLKGVNLTIAQGEFVAVMGPSGSGMFLGYIAPTICISYFHFYPDSWTNLFYLPLPIGLYLFLLHTVVRGWRRGRNRYRNIVSRSMMKFQGKQTVNNMLVMTLILAG